MIFVGHFNFSNDLWKYSYLLLINSIGTKQFHYRTSSSSTHFIRGKNRRLFFNNAAEAFEIQLNRRACNLVTNTEKILFKRISIPSLVVNFIQTSPLDMLRFSGISNEKETR